MAEIEPGTPRCTVRSPESARADFGRANIL